MNIIFCFHFFKGQGAVPMPVCIQGTSGPNNYKVPARLGGASSFPAALWLSLLSPVSVQGHPGWGSGGGGKQLQACVHLMAPGSVLIVSS